MVRDIQNIDDDIVRKKRIIGEMLYSDPDIIEVLDNKELDPSCPELQSGHFHKPLRDIRHCFQPSLQPQPFRDR